MVTVLGWSLVLLSQHAALQEPDRARFASSGAAQWGFGSNCSGGSLQAGNVVPGGEAEPPAPGELQSHQSTAAGAVSWLSAGSGDPDKGR